MFLETISICSYLNIVFIAEKLSHKNNQLMPEMRKFTLLTVYIYLLFSDPYILKEKREIADLYVYWRTRIKVKSHLPIERTWTRNDNFECDVLNFSLSWPSVYLIGWLVFLSWTLFMTIVMISNFRFEAFLTY